MLIDQIKCNHLDKPLKFIKNIHGDEINHLNARSVWKCLDCGKIIMRSLPYEKIEQYRVLDLQKENKIEKLKKEIPVFAPFENGEIICKLRMRVKDKYEEPYLNFNIVSKINQLIDAVNELKGKK